MNPILSSLRKTAWLIIAISIIVSIIIWIKLPSLQSMQCRLHDIVPLRGNNIKITHYERGINGDYAIFLEISKEDFEKVRFNSSQFKKWNKLTQEHSFQIGHHTLCGYEGMYSVMDSQEGRTYCLLWDKHKHLLIFSLCSSIF